MSPIQFPNESGGTRAVANPLQEGQGAATWADRDDRCDLTLHGDPKIQPMRVLPDFHVAEQDRDPRGMKVIAGCGTTAGEIIDIWADRSEPQIRYLEMKIDGAEPGMPILAPMGFCRVTDAGIQIKALHAKDMPAIPRPKANDRITLLEEDRVFAYFAGGYRYSDPNGLEPLI